MSGSSAMTKPKRRKTAQRPRLQMDFAPEAFSRLDEMRELAGVRTNAELIRNALRMYDWLLVASTRNEAVRVQLVNGEKTRDVELLMKWPAP
jgi:hypothetical protein